MWRSTHTLLTQFLELRDLGCLYFAPLTQPPARYVRGCALLRRQPAGTGRWGCREGSAWMEEYPYIVD